MWVHRSLLEVVVVMNCFGSHTESTESLIRHEEDNVSEVIEVKEDEDQTGEDEVGEEMEEEKLLTDEELGAIAKEVDKREGESVKKKI